MAKSIVCLHPLTKEQQEAIRKAAPGYTLALTDAKQPDLDILAEAEIVIGWTKGISGRLLREGTPLRWVQSWSAGVEKLPLDRLEERGIVLTNASGVHAAPIAQVIFGFILLFVRNLHSAIRNQDRHLWSSDGNESELTDKTAVIVGTGDIGGETARIAKAFRMRTIGVRRLDDPLPGFDVMYTTSRLKEAVSEGDFVINTLPLTDKTRRLFDASVFSAFKEGAYYINIGRGGTTDTGALVEALKNGRLRGAGLDVFETEPLSKDHPLWDMKQVIITPHIAGLTDYYGDRLMDIFTENMKSYLACGAPSKNVIDYGRQY
ncbi:Phosphoglycerate dehydrogenase [Paenibacillus sophorae]|uniref:Phosphoglycerate dehydrogenase n=1 Tax=Paenibacillus sophorae TaxID=1333845 RepID=A0A1H8TB55_9BACL|nr:D-2-hydroxyacid dehydrogenase [Paenibacillus sophorae]SEO88045.1 Phosphoglycerate dehydrogenase [Paenibacillus sophorae]